MKQYLWMKAIAGLIGLCALLYGISIMDADPTLRVMQDVTMADIEAGRMPRDGQLVRINDAWLLPTWVVEYSQSRKRGDHAHVHVGIGSAASFQHAASGQTTDVKLWLRLPQDYRTREAASAAMNRDSIYGKAESRVGVINELPESVRSSIADTNTWTSRATMRLEEGAKPSSAGDGVGFAAAGALALLLVAAWAAADYFSDIWRRGLGGPDCTTFAGTSPWLLGFALSLLAAPPLLFVAAATWVDVRVASAPLAGSIVALLALGGFSLWRNRVAWIVTPKGLARADHGGAKPLVRWEAVDALAIAERHFRGNVAVTYTLHAGQRQFKVGNGLFSGGVDAHGALGQLLREQVAQQVAPALLARLAAGERVGFGTLGACRDGLIKGKLQAGEVLPWAEIESSALKDGILRIKRKGKVLAWEKVSLGKLRNPDLLLQLIQQRGLGQVGNA